LQIELLSPAKINLFLLINRRRADGYHDLQTLFQILDYGDSMSFKPASHGDIRLLTEFKDVEPNQNLIIHAAKLLRQKLASRGLDTAGVEIEITKRLPMGGGLGGGSSNAATTLLALNTLWQGNLNKKELTELGIQLGADVPIFIAGKSAFAEGLGEKLTSTKIPKAWYLVLDPKVNISTAEIFLNPQLTRDSAPIKIPALAAECIRNDCQIVVEKLHPEVAKARIWLDRLGEARLTGTGACLFVELSTEADALNIFDQIPSDWNGFVAKGVNESPTHKQLNCLKID
jgi:4-diphosphocytidyl-2-C-methyl-D-erythritol kinase|tara:strand:- start:16090 stop:16950 length:861 start_codon:yes stop_codon:yes gene_type:complete